MSTQRLQALRGELEVGERVAGVGVDRAQGRLARRPVVRVARPDPLPVDFRGLHEHPLRLHLPDDPGDVASEVEARAHPAVRVAQEHDVLDPELLGGGALLVLPDAADLLARDRRVEAARVAVGDDAVGHRDALGGPGRDRARRPEVDVVGVRHDHEGPLDRKFAHVRHPAPGKARPARQC